MVVGFVELCKMITIKFKANKSKEMALSGEAGSIFEIFENGMRLGHISGFKCLWFEFLHLARMS